MSCFLFAPFTFNCRKLHRTYVCTRTRTYSCGYAELHHNCEHSPATKEITFAESFVCLSLHGSAKTEPIPFTNRKPREKLQEFWRVVHAKCNR